MRDGTARRPAVRLAYAILFVSLAVVFGKACQYAAVGALGDRLGFEVASIIGLAPFFGVLAVLKARYPRYFAFRG